MEVFFEEQKFKSTTETFGVGTRKAIPVPTYMSVDEVAWQKWHKYVTNVVDIEKKSHLELWVFSKMSG